MSFLKTFNLATVLKFVRMQKWILWSLGFYVYICYFRY